MNEVLEQVYFNNAIRDYVVSFLIIVGGILLLRIFRKKILNRLKSWADKTETTVDNFLVIGIEKYGLPLFNFLVLYYGLHYLHFTSKIQNIVNTSITVIATYFIVRLLVAIIRMALEEYVRKQDRGEEKLKQLRGVVVVISVMIWSLGAIFLFSNLGYDVTAVITGLGIGGIAIALAAQNILGDLFNYFVIFFDRPFEVGDFIVVDDKKGDVEYIGIKSTRIKSLTGEQLIFSNSDLTKSRIHNFKRMQRRRIVFTLGVTYQTKSEHLENIPKMIKSIVESQKNATFDRSHFSSFGDFSLNYETVYFVESQEYHVYMDVHQEINLSIVRAFAKEGVEFAYPTQTVYEHKIGYTKE